MWFVVLFVALPMLILAFAVVTVVFVLQRVLGSKKSHRWKYPRANESTEEAESAGNET
jgi:hypothetical protein